MLAASPPLFAHVHARIWSTGRCAGGRLGDLEECRRGPLRPPVLLPGPGPRCPLRPRYLPPSALPHTQALWQVRLITSARSLGTCTAVTARVVTAKAAASSLECAVRPLKWADRAICLSPSAQVYGMRDLIGGIPHCIGDSACL